MNSCESIGLRPAFTISKLIIFVLGMMKEGFPLNIPASPPWRFSVWLGEATWLR